MTGAHDDLPRRDFLKLTWGVTAALAAAGSTFIGLRFLGSRKGGGPFGGVIAAGSVDDFPPGTVTAFPEGRFYLVRAADGGFLALYHKCTHLDCVVLWDEAAGHFYCPCHGSRFSTDGDVQNAPAPRPLSRFPVLLDDDDVAVDTGSLIERAAIQADDLMYPGGEPS